MSVLVMFSDSLISAPFDRAALLRRDPQDLAARLSDAASCIIPLWRLRNLVRRNTGGVEAVRVAAPAAAELTAAARETIFLGVAGDTACFALDLSAVDDPAQLLPLGEAHEFVDLRRVGSLMSDDEAALLAYARALVHWHSGHRFCGRCGAPTESREGGHMRQCTNSACATQHFPRTDPAIIVLVTAGDRCLLGRQPSWAPGMFSVLAGFVEPGETIEQAVAREVMEETGVRVRNISYQASQPWPFPASLMIGFRAEAEEAVQPQVDGMELEKAEWFSRSDLDAFAERGLWLPDRFSIARRLVDAWHSGQS